MEGVCNTVGLMLPNAAALMTPVGCRPEVPLAEPDGLRALDPEGPPRAPPVELCVGVLLVEGDLDDGVAEAPWRGEARVSDRGSLPSLSLENLLGTLPYEPGSRTSTPESVSAALVSTCPEDGIAKICPRFSPNVAVLDPLPATLSGTDTRSAIAHKSNLRLITCESAGNLRLSPLVMRMFGREVSLKGPEGTQDSTPSARISSRAAERMPVVPPGEPDT